MVIYRYTSTQVQPSGSIDITIGVCVGFPKIESPPGSVEGVLPNFLHAFQDIFSVGTGTFSSSPQLYACQLNGRERPSSGEHVLESFQKRERRNNCARKWQGSYNAYTVEKTLKNNKGGTMKAQKRSLALSIILVFIVFVMSAMAAGNRRLH